MEWTRKDYRITTDKSLISADFVYENFSLSYPSLPRSLPEISKSIENSICFGMFHKKRPVGFARVVTDLSTIYVLSDVFIVQEHRGKGLGKWLMDCIVNYPDFQGLVGILATKDAQGLYRKYGFRSPNDPRIMMLRLP